MQIIAFSDPSCFDKLNAEWHELLGRAAINHIFMTPEFLQVWWQTLGQGELQVITLREDSGRLVGIAPFFTIDTEWRLLGCQDVSDYLDAIIDRETADSTYQALSEYLQQQSWQKLTLCSVPATSPSRSHFNQSKWHVEEQQQEVCPVISLPKTWDEYLTQIGKKQRHELKRKWQKLIDSLPATFQVIDNAQLSDQDVADFISLHQHSSANKAGFWDEKHVAFFQQWCHVAAQKNWLRLYFLKIQGRRAATMLGFEYGDQFFLYNSGFAAEDYREYSVGNVLTSYTIKDAIERGKTRYDFLRGSEEYKFRYGAVAEPIFNLTISRFE